MSTDQKDESAPSGKPRSLSRKYLPRLGSKERLLAVDWTEDMLNLQKVLQNRFTRNRLINKLLPIKADYSVRIRFCSAVEEFESTKDKIEKKQKARKIVTMFVQPGSLFQLSNIPPTYEKELLNDKLDCLEDLKKVILDDLCRIEDVKREFMRLLPEAEEGRALTVNTSATPAEPSKQSKRPSVNVLSTQFYDVVISPPPSPGSGLVQTVGGVRAESSSPASTPPGSPQQSPGGTRRRLPGLPRLGSKERVVQQLEETPEMKSLEKIILDRGKRQELILKLLPIKVDYSVKVRFCSAVREYERVADKVDRKAKARKIVSLFVQNGSMFQLSGIPDRLRDDLLHERFEALEDLRRLAMTELVEVEQVKSFLKTILEKDPHTAPMADVTPVTTSSG